MCYYSNGECIVLAVMQWLVIWMCFARSSANNRRVVSELVLQGHGRWKRPVWYCVSARWRCCAMLGEWFCEDRKKRRAAALL